MYILYWKRIGFEQQCALGELKDLQDLYDMLSKQVVQYSEEEGNMEYVMIEEFKTERTVPAYCIEYNPIPF